MAPYAIIKHMAEVTAYCVKEKKKGAQMLTPELVEIKAGRWAYRGKCASCGTMMYRITKKPE